MKTIEEIRREWLIELIQQYKSIANLNIALDRAKTDATLSQIKNQATDSKSRNPRNMGSPLAREIEEKLGLEVGSLDHEKHISSTPQQQKINPWDAYESADDAIKSVVDFILHKDDLNSHPGWVDSDARAYIDSLELKAYKWVTKRKNYEIRKTRKA
ncbi:MAG: hypothetical protein ACL7AY_16215 [Candidatus Arsenophonus phytopathogenicus]